MKVYHYDQTTGAPIGESTADSCPITGKPLIPAFATTEAPPAAGEGQAVKWSKGKWKVEKLPKQAAKEGAQ